MSKGIQKAISTWIMAAIVLVVGILCIVAENASGDTSGNAYASISYVIGITLIVIAVLGIILNTIVKKRTATSETIADGIMLSIGIYFVCNTALGGTVLGMLVNYVPYLLVVEGALIAVDAILILVTGIACKGDAKAYIVGFAVELAIAAVAIVLGVLALPGVDVITAKFTILGIILIVYAVYQILAGVLYFIDAKKITKEFVETIDENDVVGQA